MVVWVKFQLHFMQEFLKLLYLCTVKISEVFGFLFSSFLLTRAVYNMCILLIDVQAKSPIKTLDELSVTEVLPSLYFPSIMERSEMESLNGSLSCSKTSDHELPANYLDTSRMSIQKNSTDCCQGFGHRSRHRCYVITARARSFLYHQVHFLLFHASLHGLAFLLFICFTPFPIFILSIDRSVLFFVELSCVIRKRRHCSIYVLW